MGFTEAIRVCLRKYADFSGRATRSEFWWFRLGVFIGFFIVYLLVAISIAIHLSFVANTLVLLFILGILLPDIAVTARRLHDVNKSGWWLLIVIIPFGAFYLLYLLVQPTQPETNRFGEPPKS